MNIQIISVWYNEELLAPFFLNHYNFADKIHVVIDSDTDDRTLEIISRYSNVQLHEITFPDKFDDLLKIDKINSIYFSLDCDWVVAVDSDEFIFPLPLGTTLDNFLQNNSKNEVIYAQMWQVYRHHTDADLDPDSPPVLQRRHGDPNVLHGVNTLYTKPAVVKAGMNFKWEVGCHKFARPKNKLKRTVMKYILKKPRISSHILHGVHWPMADPAIIRHRTNNRVNRLSKKNLEFNMSLHFECEEQKLLDECELHFNDPLLF